MSDAVAKQIFSGFTNPSAINQTIAFSGCDFLVINALGIGGDQLEIAAAIQISVVTDLDLLNGAIQVPQADLGQKELPLDLPFFDTGVIIPLPLEATRSNCECKVCLSTIYSVNIEIYSVSKKSLCDCQAELKEIKDIVEFIRLLNAGIAINQLGQNVAFLAIATTVGVALAPLTGGASLALPAGTAQALGAGTSTITPLLIGSGLLLGV
jgi:hypothetical protein